MRAWITKQLNSFYVKVFLRAGKWTLLVLLLTLLLLGLGARFVLPKAIKEARKQSNTQVVGSGSEAEVYYKDKALPKDFGEELDAEAPVLIYENQLRSIKDNTRPDAKGRPEDFPGRVEGVDVRPSERRALVTAANIFLSRWETFSPSTDPEEYKQSLAPLVAEDGLDDIAERKDNIQRKAIAPGGQVGSQWMTDGFNPTNRLAVRRFDGQTAYITTAGEITTAGPSLVLNDLRYIRTYALVLEKQDGRWKVRRAVAQTQTEVIG